MGKNAEYDYHRVFDAELREINNFNDYLEKITNIKGYTIAITMIGEYSANDKIVKSIYSNFNINKEIYTNNVSYVIENNELIYSSDGQTNYLFHKELNKYNDLALDSGIKIFISRTNLKKTENGINFVIFDNITSEVVDFFALEYINGSITDIVKRD